MCGGNALMLARGARFRPGVPLLLSM